MELAAATEDAQQARLELRAARAELARAKAQQAAVRAPFVFFPLETGFPAAACYFIQCGLDILVLPIPVEPCARCVWDDHPGPLRVICVGPRSKEAFAGISKTRAC